MPALATDERTRNLARFGYAALLSAWLIGFVCWMIVRFVQGRLLFSAAGNVFNFTDYVSFYRTGKMALAHIANVYDPIAQLDVYNQVIAPLHVTQSAYAQYVPWVFLLMAPFAMVGLGASFWLWTAVWSACGAFALNRLLQAMELANAKSRALFLIAFFASYPILQNISDGQITMLLTCALALACIAWFRRNDLLCGALLAVLSIKPQYLVLLMVPALARRRSLVIVGAVATIALFVAASMLQLGVGTVLNYPHTLLSIETAELTVFPTWQVSVRGPLSMLLGYKAGFYATVVMYVMTGLGLLWLWWRTDRRRMASPLHDGAVPDHAERAAMAATVVASLVASPHCHVYDLTLLGAPAALIWTQASTRLRALLIALPIIGIATFIITDIFPLHELLPFVFLPINVFFLCSCIAAWRCDTNQSGHNLLDTTSSMTDQ